jgi:hypothetical protein
MECFSHIGCTGIDVPNLGIRAGFVEVATPKSATHRALVLLGANLVSFAEICASFNWVSIRYVAQVAAQIYCKRIRCDAEYAGVVGIKRLEINYINAIRMVAPKRSGGAPAEARPPK